jgi:hypothetical protein
MRTKFTKMTSELFIQFDRTHTQFILSALARTTRGIAGFRRLPRLLLIGLVSEYDVFLSELIRAVISVRPQSLLNSDKIEASTLPEFADISEAREYLIEREIDSIMVKSHLDQLKELNRISGATIDLDDVAVRTFLEICERRNLFAHTGGIVSNRYITKCKSLKIELKDEVKVGTEIRVDRSYFTAAVSTLHELCMKLCHFIWHKTVPGEHELADKTVHGACFDLIRLGDSEVAKRILAYVTRHTKISTEIWRRKLVLLYATALKLSGDFKNASDELDRLD